MALAIRATQMAYDRAIILREVRRHLRDRPAVSLVVIASELKVDRHTLARALYREGLSFEHERRRMIATRLNELRELHRPLSTKEVAHRNR